MTKRLLISFGLALAFVVPETFAQNNYAAGTNAGQGGSQNTSVGVNAGNFTTGTQNTFLGYNAGGASGNGSGFNTILGSQSGQLSTSGGYNTFMGFQSGYSSTSSSHNVMIGVEAGYSIATTQYNTLIGVQAGRNATGSNNLMLGYQSGQNSSGSYNVFLGPSAGKNETTSNKLYIDNSDTATPLIYGDFSLNRVGINALPGSYTLNVGGTLNATEILVNGAPFAGQWTTQGPNIYFSTGNIGVGTNTPLSKLHLDFASTNTNFSSITNSDVGLLIKNTNTTNNNFNVVSLQDAYGFSIGQFGTVTTNHGTHTGRLFFAARGASGMVQRLIVEDAKTTINNTLYTPGILLESATPTIQMQAGATYLQIANNSSSPSGLKSGGMLVADSYGYANPSANDLIVKGKIAIGTPVTTSTNNYVLAVNGKIGGHDVQIERTSNAWPDYVFEPGYKLPGLGELENFIHTNGHLPGVPTAKEVEENGYSVASLDATLLEKIEELTLYLIEQKKLNEKQQQEIEELRTQVQKKKRRK
jgi:trimeric autotransporter adhesin